MQPRLAVKQTRCPSTKWLEWWGLPVAPHLAETGCFETGTPTLTRSSVKIAEVCTDVTGGTPAPMSSLHASPSRAWGELEEPGSGTGKEPSFPLAERTCMQSDEAHIHFTMSGHCIPHTGQMS